MTARDSRHRIAGRSGSARRSTITGGNLERGDSTATTGNLTKNGGRFLHDYGVQNVFLSRDAGNFTMSGTANTASGVQALGANTTGEFNTASELSGALFQHHGRHQHGQRRSRALDPSRLRGLTTEQKVPYVLKIIGASTISTRLRASLLEVEQSISTWPQLASSVALGGAVAADVARRMLLGHQTASGRFFVDVEDVIPNRTVTAPAAPNRATSAGFDPSAVAGRLTEPASGRDLTPAQVRRLVTAATLAPSGGNSQPWTWLWQDRRLHAFIDTTHSRAVVDFRSLAAVAAIGAASENLVLAAHADGLGVRLRELPLTAATLELALHPMTALAYLFARLHVGGGEELSPEMIAGLRALWPRWSTLFGVDTADAAILVFRVSRAAAPTARSLRCPVDEILRFG